MNRYTVIIPVYGAIEHVKRCVESVFRNTDYGVHDILIIDDCSKDADVLRQLRNYDAELIFHDQNVGFVRTANEGIMWASDHDSDPILLNSDTVVPARWIERLDAARNSNPKCCSVSPLSNNCSHYSIPNVWSGELPMGVTVDEMDRITEETSDRAYPSVPCSIGFCMLMTRKAIAEVGVFDQSWGRGYGEETDWCVRAIAKGYTCVLADNLFVYHKHQGSFGAESQSLRLANQQKFLSKYPSFERIICAWNLRSPQRGHRTRVADRLRPRVSGAPQMKVLYVLHNWGKLGGSEIFTRRLIESLSDEIEITILHPFRGDLVEDGAIYQETNGVIRIAMSPRLIEAKVQHKRISVSVRCATCGTFFRESGQGVGSEHRALSSFSGLRDLRVSRNCKPLREGCLFDPR